MKLRNQKQSDIRMKFLQILKYILFILFTRILLRKSRNLNFCSLFCPKNPKLYIADTWFGSSLQFDRRQFILLVLYKIVFVVINRFLGMVLSFQKKVQEHFFSLQMYRITVRSSRVGVAEILTGLLTDQFQQYARMYDTVYQDF